MEPICRFCDWHSLKRVPATTLAGQWAGGDEGVDPQWVPVCDDHLEHWFEDVEDEDRLPTFPLNNKT